MLSLIILLKYTMKILGKLSWTGELGFEYFDGQGTNHQIYSYIENKTK